MTAPRTLTIVLTSATHALTPGFLVRAGKEIADGLEDAVAENREECVRCLGAYLHLAASVQLGPGEAEAAGLGRAVSSVLGSLALHMDDDSSQLRDIILGCLITLPPSLHPSLAPLLQRSLATHRHKQHIHTLLNTLQSDESQVDS